MERISIAEIVTAVRDTLAQARGVTEAESLDQLSEGAEDLPLMKVYHSHGEVSNATGRTTLRAGVRLTTLTVKVDVYVRQRSHLGEDMAKTVELTDAIVNLLEAQETKPYFGLPGIQAFTWQFDWVVFVYGDPETRYAGTQFTIVLTLF